MRCVSVGRIEGEFILNPTFADMECSDLDLRLTGTQEALIMVECGAQEVPEQVIVDAPGIRTYRNPIFNQRSAPNGLRDWQTQTREYVPYMIEETIDRLDPRQSCSAIAGTLCSAV